METMTELAYLQYQLRDDWPLSDEDRTRICELLDAAQPERRDGECFCLEGLRCTYSEEGIMGRKGPLHWRDPVTHDWLAIGLYCRRCGAALREGYAERSGAAHPLSL